ncbi:MAG: aminotransferase class I/II-fold pyridoxal phosphate-dependent enzyme [Holophaga sp.]|nr:aminotransferase class I/II-fold pyridoxal phosphate-dependent enzyme [Holophaga sp.]
MGLSPTMAGAAAIACHPDPVDLSIGEPEGPPPLCVREAAAAAALEGRTRYGPVAGLPELRDQVAQDLSHRDGVAYTQENVIITSGGKAAILDALRCVLNPGDEVLIFAPYWPSFRDQVVLAGGVPVIVPFGEDYLPTLANLEGSFGALTKAVILNQPSNPTGCVWDATRIQVLAQLVQRYCAWIIVDQVYGTLTLERPETPFLRQVPELQDRCIVVESFSKRFAMTGYRLGAAAGPLPLIGAMVSLASNSVTHPSMVSQHAGIAALGMDGKWEQAMVTSLRKRRDRMMGELDGLSGLRLHPPKGALYLFPNITDWLVDHGVANDIEFVRRLREESGVKVLPGSVFGAKGHFRISYAGPETEVWEGLRRLRVFLKSRSVCAMAKIGIER